MVKLKEFVNKRKEYKTYEEYVESQFPNYNKGYKEICPICKEPISIKQKNIYCLCSNCFKEVNK